MLTATGRIVCLVYPPPLVDFLYDGVPLWILSELRGNGEMCKGEIFLSYQQQFSRSKTTLERDLEELRQRGLMRFDGEKRTGCWRFA